MRQVKLYIGMSLDGYIADRHGGVDWMVGHGDASDDIDTYSLFTQSIDTVIMGWKTYDKVVTDLSPDNWVYSAFETYVITHKNISNKQGITFTAEHPVDLVKRLSRGDGKGIWICGGANIIGQLMSENLIDVYQIAIIPTLLGGGIRLFNMPISEIPLQLVDTKQYNGISELTYIKR